MKTTEEAVLELSQDKQEALINRFGLHETGLKHIDCPFCNKKNKQGDGCRINWTHKLGDPQYASICAGCGAKGIMGMLFALSVDLMQVNKEIGFKYGQDDQPAQQMNITQTKETRLIDIFKSSMPLYKSDHAKLYLMNRGINIVPSYMIRFKEQLPYYDNKGAMLGNFDAIVSCATNALERPAYMHITYIDNGHKLELGDNPARKAHSLMPESHKPRCSIKLGQRAPSVLAVGEGIESCLSYEQLYGVPTDSCLNAGLLENYRPPENVEEFHIVYDNDKKWGGQAAAHKLKHSVACRCPNVKKIVMRGPSDSGNDFNDVLLDGLGVDTVEWFR